MLHYVTTGPRTVPVCPARHRRGCDVQRLAFTGPNPVETGDPLFPQRQAHPEARTSAHTHTHGTYLGFFLLPLFQCPLKQICTGEVSGPHYRQASGFQMFPQPWIYLQELLRNFTSRPTVFLGYIFPNSFYLIRCGECRGICWVNEGIYCRILVCRTQRKLPKAHKKINSFNSKHCCFSLS